MAIRNNISALQKEIEHIKQGLSKSDLADTFWESISPEHKDKIAKYTLLEVDTLSDTQAMELKNILALYGESISDNMAKYWPAFCRWSSSLSEREQQEINIFEKYEVEFNKFIEQRRAN